MEDLFLKGNLRQKLARCCHNLIELGIYMTGNAHLLFQPPTKHIFLGQVAKVELEAT